MNIITGLHDIEEALKLGQGERLLAEKSTKRVAQLKDLARKKGVAFESVPRGGLGALCGDREHKGVILIGRKTEISAQQPVDIETVLKQDKCLLLILDGLTDPQNLGAIIRSADQFGVDAVVLPERRTVKINDTVRKVSSGASRWVTVHTEKNLGRFLERLKKEGFWIYGADMAGIPAAEESFPSKTCLIMGSEGRGLGSLLGKNCDRLIRIPTGGHVDSLNVSVAAGILLYEVRRQRGF